VLFEECCTELFKTINITISKTTVKTIAMKRSILRVSVEATLFAGFVVGTAVGACTLGVTCASVGTEVFMNDLGGTCEGAGENTVFCAEGFTCVRIIFCPGFEGKVNGESVDRCCGSSVE